MDDFLTDSEDEMFESAEESPDENEDKLVDCKEKNNKHSDLYSETKKPVEVENCQASDKIESSVKNVTHDSVIYRKRPERAKSAIKDSLSKTINISRSFRDDSKSIKDVIGPDNLFQDITTNLSKNINKSLNTIQQTSSNVKDLIFNSFPVAGAIKKNMFFYDDVGFHTKSPPVEGNVHFDDKVLSLESFDTLDSKFLKDIDQVNSFNMNSKVSEKFANNTKSKVAQSLKSDIKNDVIHNNNNLCNEINALDLDNQYSKLLEISEQKDIDSETIVLESEDNHFSQQKTMPLLNDTDREDYFNKEKEKSIIINDEKLKENNSSDIDALVDDKSLLNSILPDLDLICEPQEKNMGDSKAKQCESILDSKNKEIKVECEKSNYDLLQSATNKTEQTTLFKNLYKSKNQKKNKLFDTKKEEILRSCDSTYSTCEQLPQNIDDTSKISISEKNSDQDATTWKDPIINWIDKTTSDEADNQFNRNLKEELQKKSKNSIDTESNKKDNTNKEINQTLFKSDFENIANNRVENITKKEESDLKERNDEWDDFDFSDSESTDLEVASANAEFEKSTSKCIENNSNKNSLSSNKIIIDSKVSDEHNISYKNEEHKKDIVQEPSNFNHKPEELSIIEVKNKSDDWNWEDWDSDDNSKMELNNDIIEEDESKENCSREVWSHWETFGKKEDKKQTNWGSWGVNLLLNKASAVTQGISSALENSLGAPDAQTLAKLDHYERKSQHDQDKENTNIDKDIKLENTSSDSKLFSSIGITDLVVGVTSKIVDHSKFQEIGSKVISGGLDTLESFGKKTMEVLQDGDPGLRNKRALLLGQPKPTLSQVLKEIKDKTEKELREAEKKEIDKKCHFESMFDDYQGLVHLEALEMLSKQCELKLEQIRNSCDIEQQEDFDGVLEEVAQLCSLDDYDLTLAINSNDFEKSLIKAVSPLKNEVSLQKIFEVQKDFNQWLQSSSSFENELSLVSIEQKLVATLAKLTAAIIHQYHKAGELLSVKECRKTVEEIDALSEMTHILIKEIGHISNSFISLSQELFKGTENLALLVNKIDFIMNNSTTYIKQAFTLLIPVLQMGAAVN